MARFIGEFECKIDSKGRIILPAKLRSQIPDKDAKAMVINRGFEKCLAARKFIRQFNNGANIVPIDTSSRINIPNNLIEYASLKGDIIISCYNHKIEIWDKKHYEEELKFDDEEFSKMAEDLMGGSNNNRSIIGFETDGKDD